MDKTTTIPTLPANAPLREVTTKESTGEPTESQIFSPTPAGSLPDATTAQHNQSGWDNPFSGERESRPWGNNKFYFPDIIIFSP